MYHGEIHQIPRGMEWSPYETTLAGFLANSGFYSHGPNRKLRIFTIAKTSKESLSISRTVLPKFRKGMSLNMLSSAQVISSVQEQPSHIAEGSMSRDGRDSCRSLSRKHYTTLSEPNHSRPFHTLNTISPRALIALQD